MNDIKDLEMLSKTLAEVLDLLKRNQSMGNGTNQSVLTAIEKVQECSLTKGHSLSGKLQEVHSDLYKQALDNLKARYEGEFQAIYAKAPHKIKVRRERDGVGE